MRAPDVVRTVMVDFWLRVFPAFGFGLKLRKCGSLRWVAASGNQTGQDKLFDSARVNFVQYTDGGLVFTVLIGN
jgi:hypothetical protein